MNLLRCMAPIAGLLLLPATVVLEPHVIKLAASLSAEYPSFLLFLAFNCFLAYFVNLTNFLVTKYTSALSLQARAPIIPLAPPPSLFKEVSIFPPSAIGPGSGDVMIFPSFLPSPQTHVRGGSGTSTGRG